MKYIGLDHLTLSTTTWQYQRPPDNINDHLTLSTTTWQYQRPPDNINDHLTISTTTWHYQQPPDIINDHLTISTTTWQYQRPPDIINNHLTLSNILATTNCRYHSKLYDICSISAELLCFHSISIRGYWRRCQHLDIDLELLHYGGVWDVTNFSSLTLE